MFYPNKVMIYDGVPYEGCFPKEGWLEKGHNDGPFVLKADYDELLERHRALEKYLDDNSISLPQHLWSKRRYANGVASQQDALARHGWPISQP